MSTIRETFTTGTKKICTTLKYVMVAITIFFNTTGYAAIVAPANRVLVIITDLDTHGFQELAPLYTSLENTAIAMTTSPTLRMHYREVRVLRDQNATLEKFRDLLLSMSARSEVDAVDTFLMLHGLDDRLSFFEATYTVGEIQAFINRADTVVERLRRKIMQKKLRLMYNTSCFGSSHRAMFREVGYDAVVGSIGVNANSEFEFPSFLGLWTMGATIENALAPTNNPYMLGLADGAIRAIGEFRNDILAETNSRKVISGDRDLTINTPVH